MIIVKQVNETSEVVKRNNRQILISIFLAIMNVVLFVIWEGPATYFFILLAILSTYMAAAYNQINMASDGKHKELFQAMCNSLYKRNLVLYGDEKAVPLPYLTPCVFLGFKRYANKIIEICEEDVEKILGKNKTDYDQAMKDLNKFFSKDLLREEDREDD